MTLSITAISVGFILGVLFADIFPDRGRAILRWPKNFWSWFVHWTSHTQIKERVNIHTSDGSHRSLTRSAMMTRCLECKRVKFKLLE